MLLGETSKDCEERLELCWRQERVPVAFGRAKNGKSGGATAPRHQILPHQCSVRVHVLFSLVKLEQELDIVAVSLGSADPSLCTRQLIVNSEPTTTEQYQHKPPISPVRRPTLAGFLTLFPSRETRAVGWPNQRTYGLELLRCHCVARRCEQMRPPSSPVYAPAAGVGGGASSRTVQSTEQAW